MHYTTERGTPKSNRIEKAAIATVLGILLLSMNAGAIAIQSSTTTISSSGTISYLPLINLSVNTQNVIGTNNLSLGFNLHFYWERETWRTRSAMQQLTVDMNTKMIRLFDYQLSPCSNWNDETKTGTFDWTYTDTIITAILDAGATPLIALGFIDSHNIYVPSGMSITDTGLPDPDSFAAYAREWVKHFKQAGLPVKHYEIFNEASYYFYPNWNWNEAKAGHFLTLYNTAYNAMHNESEEILVGNDAALHRKFLDFWKAKGGKLDFLSFHKYDCDNLAMGDTTPLDRADQRYFVTDSYFYGVNDARELWGTDLPAIASEANWAAFCSQGTDTRIHQVVGAVWLALVLRKSMLENVQYNLYYSFSSSKSWELANKATGGWGFGMINQDDNQPWYPYYVQNLIGRNLSVGDSLLETSSSSNDVKSIAWLHNGILNYLIICKVDEPRTLRLQGLSGELDFAKIDNTISYVTPRVQSGKMDSDEPIVVNGFTVIRLQTSIYPNLG